ncbi:MAG: hypothetical protein NVS2B14_08440 [Chamaesiphon sp.]
MSKPHTAVVVFDGNPTETIIREGGSFSWVLNRDVARQCDYLICCRSFTRDNELKDSAFLIGKISDIFPSADPEETTQKRWMIAFSEYAIVNIPDVWKKWQNPVHYFRSEEIQELEEKLEKSLDELDFNPVMKAKREPQPEAEPEEWGAVKPLTIKEAKMGLAKFFGVDINAIEIVIRA